MPLAYPKALLATAVLFTLLSCIGAPYPDQMYLQHIPTVAAFVALAHSIRRWPLSNASFTCLVVFLLFHVLGARYIYSYVPYDRWSELLFGTDLTSIFHFRRNHYDRVVHFAFGALFVRPVWEISVRYFGVPRRVAWFMAIQFVLAFSLLYELFEWGLTMVFSPEDADAYNGQQGDIWDAHKDMGLALVGAVVGILLKAPFPRADRIMPKVWTGSKFPMPERLYRYRPLACEKDWGYLEQILLDSTMYGAPPAILKQMDPEDCRVAVNTLCTLDEFKQSRYGQEATKQHPEWSESELDSHLRQWHKNLMMPDFDPGVTAALQRDVDQYGVICFSMYGDIPTQWQNYASERRGVCLEFDPLKDLDFFGKVKPVDYVDVLEPANVFTDTGDVQVRKRLYTKLAKYESEAEFRALFECRAGQQIPFRTEALVKVKPGSAMNEADCRRLKVILRRRSAKTGFKVYG